MNQALKKILIKSKKQVFSEIIGNNTTPKKGEGYDFCELKEYEYGEDIKNIDWVISAKMQKPYVKVFHSQREQNIKIVNLMGGSLFFGTSRFKQELLSEVASNLAYISIKQADPFTSYIANDGLELCTKKSKRSFNVQFMAEKLYSYDLLNKQIDYEKITKELFKNINHKSIIFLIGDFFEVQNLDLKLLKQKHEVFVLILRDKFEEEPKQMGNISFNDPSTNKNYEGHIGKSTIKNYKQKIKENDHLLYKHLQDCSIRFTKIYTHEDSIKKLIGLFR